MPSEEKWGVVYPDKDRIALEQLVSYYMHERKLGGRDIQRSVYESAEKMLAIWKLYVVDAFTPDMDYLTVKNIEKTKMGVIKNILSFIDKDLPKKPEAAEQERQDTHDELVEALEEIRDGMPESDNDYYDGWAYKYRVIAEKALKATERF